MANLEGVREYNRIRRYLEYIYLYGFFSREDFAQANIGSVKDYDYGVKLIRSIFPEAEGAALWKDGRKYLRVQREYALSGKNRMADSYLLYSMDVENELPTLLGIFSCLAEGKKTVDDTCRDTAIHTQVTSSLNYHTVRRWLQDLVEYGYGEKKGRYYQLRDNPLKALSEDEVWQLYWYTLFASGITYPRVAGSFLLRTLERELLRRGQQPMEESPFLLRHSVNRNIFDEDLLCRLMEAMEQHRPVRLLRETDSLLVQPAALRVDSRLGRWYLLAKGAAPLMTRVSTIRDIKLENPLSPAEWEAGVEACRTAFAHSGVSGFLSPDGPATIRAHLRVAQSPGMGAQFLRELRAGAVQSGEDGEEYQAEMNDPMELIPFLRSYSPWLSLEDGEHGLKEAIQRDLRSMRESLMEDKMP